MELKSAVQRNNSVLLPVEGIGMHARAQTHVYQPSHVQQRLHEMLNACAHPQTLQNRCTSTSNTGLPDYVHSI